MIRVQKANQCGFKIGLNALKFERGNHIFGQEGTSTFRNVAERRLTPVEDIYSVPHSNSIISIKTKAPQKAQFQNDRQSYLTKNDLMRKQTYEDDFF